MANYDWVCQSCNESVIAENDSCPNCGCPAIATGYEIEKYQIKYTGKQKESAKHIFPTWVLVIAVSTSMLLVSLDLHFNLEILNTLVSIVFPITFILFIIYWFELMKFILKKIFGSSNE